MTVAAEVLPCGNKEQATEIRLWETTAETSLA
jgi:hypothetical protein